MRAWLNLYRHELRSYLRAPFAWVFTAVYALVSGLILSIQILNGSSFLAAEWGLLQNCFFIFIPLLTMRSFAAERESGRLDLLYGLPLSNAALVLAKFCSLLSCLGLTSLVVLPHVVLTWLLGGRVDGVFFSALLAYVLQAGLYTSIGLLISLISRHAAQAGLLSLLIFIGLEFLDALAAVLGDGLSRLWRLLGLGGAMDASQAYQLAQDLTRALGRLNPLRLLQDFSRGLVRPSTVVYLLLLTSFFLLLALFRCGRERSSRVHRKGLEALLSRSLAPLALVLILLISYLLNSSWQSSSDWTQSQLMRLGSVSRQLLERLEGPWNIDIYDSEEHFRQNYGFLPQLLEDYEQVAGGRIQIRYRSTAEQRDQAVKEGLQGRDGNVIISSPKTGRKQVLEAAGLIRNVQDQQSGVYLGVDAEASISSALRNVQEEQERQVAVLNTTANRFSQRFHYLLDLLQDNGFEVSYLDIQNGKQIESSYVFLLLIGEQQDLTRAGLASLEQYLQQGGRLLLALAPLRQEYSELQTLLSELGLGLRPGQLLEGDSSRVYTGQPEQFLAPLLSGTDFSDIPGRVLFRGAAVLEDLSQALVNRGGEEESAAETQQREALQASLRSQRLMQSSKEAYSSLDEGTEPQRGVHPLLQVQDKLGWESADGTRKSRVAVLAGSSPIEDQSLSLSGSDSANVRLLARLVQELAEDQGEGRLLISRKLPVNYNLSVQETGYYRVAAFGSLFLLPFLLCLQAWRLQRRWRRL